MTLVAEQSAIKTIFKESLVEALHENRSLFEEVFSDVIEDISLGEAIRQGRDTAIVPDEDVLQILRQGS